MKKLNKIIAVLVALAMMAALSVTASFAATGSSESSPLYVLNDSKITKVWTIPEGVKDPALSATFTFSYNQDKSSGVTDADIPTLSKSTETVTYTSTYDATTSPVTTDSKYYAVNASLPTLSNIKHAGIYAVDVTETDSTVTTNNDVNGVVSQDGSKYRIYYYYKNVADETTGAVTLQLAGITVTKVTTETQTVTDEETGTTSEQDVETAEKKIDPTKDEPDDDITKADDTTKNTALKFSNIYSVTNGKDQGPEGPIDLTKVALKVTKTVTGKENDTQSFHFTITLTAAAGQSVEGIKAYVYEIGDDETKATNVTDESDNIVYKTTDADGKLTVELKDGQALAFLQLPAGTRYVVSETLADDVVTFQAYTPSYETTSNGSAGGPGFSGTAGAAVTLTTAGEDGSNTTYLLAANENDAVAYTNAYDDTINTPTGILMNNLPYIVLALVAVGGLVAYVIVRRKGNEEA